MERVNDAKAHVLDKESVFSYPDSVGYAVTLDSRHQSIAVTSSVTGVYNMHDLSLIFIVCHT